MRRLQNGVFWFQRNPIYLSCARQPLDVSIPSLAHSLQGTYTNPSPVLATLFYFPVTINEISKISGERTKSSCANKIAFLDVRGLLCFHFILFFLCIC